MSKLIVSLTLATALALLLFDVYAVRAYVNAGWPGDVSWLKVFGALALQVLVIILAFTSFALIAQRRHEAKPQEPGSGPWYLPVPLVLALVLAALSATLFFNGLVCGNEPLPTSRGVSICAR